MGHLPWLWEHPRVDLVATCAIEEERARQAAERWEAAQFYTDFYKMLDAQQLDALVVATPPQTHAEFAQAAAERGIHVLLEKPMARSTEECDAVMEAAAKNNTVLTISHEKRFNPGFEKIKEIIDSGSLGTIPTPELLGKVSPDCIC